MSSNPTANQANLLNSNIGTNQSLVDSLLVTPSPLSSISSSFQIGSPSNPTSSSKNNISNQFHSIHSISSSAATLPNSSIISTTSNNQTINSNYNLANLGKDGDLLALNREVSLLIEEVNSLAIETEAVFVGIEQIYHGDDSPMELVHRLSNLIERYTKLMNSIRLSGLGALPTNIPDWFDLTTLLESKQTEVQQLYRERQRRRQGAAIVSGVLESSSDPIQQSNQ